MKHKELKEDASDSVQENCEPKSKMQSSQGINGKYFHCDKCPFETPQLSSLRKLVGINHTEVIEGIHKTKPQKDELSYICGECGCSFADEKKCVEHVTAHIHRCYKCTFESDSPSEVLRHEKDQHKVLSCDQTSHEGDCNMVGMKKKQSSQESTPNIPQVNPSGEFFYM